MTRMFAVVLLAAGLALGGAAPGSARAAGPSELLIQQKPGDRPAYFPESISAAPSGALYVSSITTGEIMRFAPGSSTPATFVKPGVNVGTTGVMVDPLRHVLWACAVDLTPAATRSKLRAFDLETGALEASYDLPDPGGLCADIALAWGDVYVTDTALGRILRLTTPRFWRPDGGKLEPWYVNDRFRGAPLGINGIAFNGLRMLYTTNYGTGELFGVRIGLDGDPELVRSFNLGIQFPDGIRWRGGFLYVAENLTGLSRVNPRTGERTLIDNTLDQPSSLVFVGDDIWITEGQVIRLQLDETPHRPFRVVRRSAP